MNDVRKLHDEAMDLAMRADLASVEGDIETYKSLIALAADKEWAAALRAEQVSEAEPTVSVLLRSAAWLHVQCGKYDTARRIAEQALTRRCVPEEIRAELHEVLTAAINCREPASSSEQDNIHGESEHFEKWDG